MGRVVSKQIKRIGYLLFEKRKDLFKNRFEEIKESLKKIYGDKLTKKERNVLAGYIARLAKYEIKKSQVKVEETTNVM